VPELPEVETTVNMLRKSLVGLSIQDVWSDYHIGTKNIPETIKTKTFWIKMKRWIIGKKILDVVRRGKNILIHLSDNITILIHMKLTGHLLYGQYVKKHQSLWLATKKGPLREDPFNQHIHFVISLSGGKNLVLSDLRRFAKITMMKTGTLPKSKHLRNLGPDPLDYSFTKKVFRELLKKYPSRKIKTVLMDQHVISGIGNIYSDEILWTSGIHPESISGNIPEKKLTELQKTIVTILKKGISLTGDSFSDYRRPDGEKGSFQHKHQVYRKTGMPCGKKNCRGVIMRSVVGGRSAHFCNTHQKKY